MMGGMVIAADGVSLYVEDHGEGVPVLLIHGWPDSGRLWRHQVPHLAGRGFRVIAPDLRGFGRSGRAFSLPTCFRPTTSVQNACDSSMFRTFSTR